MNKNKTITVFIVLLFFVLHTTYQKENLSEKLFFVKLKVCYCTFSYKQTKSMLSLIKRIYSDKTQYLFDEFY